MTDRIIIPNLSIRKPPRAGACHEGPGARLPLRLVVGARKRGWAFPCPCHATTTTQPSSLIAVFYIVTRDVTPAISALRWMILTFQMTVKPSKSITRK